MKNICEICGSPLKGVRSWDKANKDNYNVHCHYCGNYCIDYSIIEQLKDENISFERFSEVTRLDSNYGKKTPTLIDSIERFKVLAKTHNVDICDSKYDDLRKKFRLAFDALDRVENFEDLNWKIRQDRLKEFNDQTYHHPNIKNYSELLHNQLKIVIQQEDIDKELKQKFELLKSAYNVIDMGREVLRDIEY